MTNDQVVLITGTSSGVGRAAAERLAREGFTVYASMRSPETTNADTAQQLEALAASENLALKVIELDTTDATTITAASEQVMAESGRIDVVVNNAGIASYGVLEDYTAAELARVFDVNLLGAHRVTQAALPHMRAAGRGQLIHISSGIGRVVMPTMGAYAISKWALEAFAETLRYELAPLGIDSTTIQLSVYPTSINDAPHGPVSSESQGGYGDVGTLADQLPVQFRDEFVDRTLDEPVDAVVALIQSESPRPARVAIGVESGPLAPLNAAQAAFQAGLFEGFGLSDLAALAKVGAEEDNA